ncbi:MAG: restriction endonuclease subunit S [Crenarchaeota archaeon]|jgi:type I restriction enzyme S subunit|nr:restriction endonuclease subunit S [Thermoproteota archaeon]
MKETQKLIPKRRFREFMDDGAWEQRELGNIADIVGGGTPSTSIIGYWNGDIDWYAPAEIGEQIFVHRSQKKITELGLHNSSAKILPVGTVLFTSRAGIGNTAILAKEGATNQGFQSIVPRKDGLDSYFIFSRAHELKRYGETIGAGSTFVEVSGKQMAKMPIFTPEMSEQKLIGQFFAVIDNLITLQQRKLEKIQNLKSAYLSKMFPKDGEKYPELRFAGFTDAWELRKLGEITNIKTGSSDLQDAVVDGEYPFFVRSENVERSNRYIFDGEAILIPGEGRIGDIYHYVNGKFDYHQRVYKISNFAEADIDGKFVLYYLQQNFKSHALTFTVKATVDSLRLPMLVDFEIKLPRLEEQQDIGNFFSNLDNLITLHQRKLDKLKSIKQAYLNEMFV